MNDLHIDDFYKDAATALHRLFLAFPRRIPLFVEEIAGPIATDEFGVPDARHLACFGTLLWLGEEGYLRYQDTIRTEAIDQAVLTGRCFNVLTMHAGRAEQDVDPTLPASVRDAHSTHLHRLRDALKSGSSTRVEAAMSDILALMQG